MENLWLGPIYVHMAKNLVANIRRIFVDKEFRNLIKFFCDTPFVKFLDLLVGFRKFYIFKKSWMQKNLRRIFVEYSSANSSPCVDGPLQ